MKNEKISRREMDGIRRSFDSSCLIGEIVIANSKSGTEISEEMREHLDSLRKVYHKVERDHVEDEYDRGWLNGFFVASGCMLSGFMIGTLIRKIIVK